jgi:CheY-like chemotaxis protein
VFDGLTGQAMSAILVVDDHADTVKAVRKLLQFASHRVEVAHSCAEARDLCKYFQPEVLLCDLHLPDGSGVELAREVLQLCPDACAIAVTGSTLDPQTLGGIGFRAVLTKPIDFNHLEKVMREVCVPTA